LAVSAGTYNMLAVKTDGTLWRWGYTFSAGNSPVQIGSATTWTNKISAGQGSATSESMSSGIQSDGTLWTWGFSNKGQLGLGNTTYKSSPTQVGTLTTWTSVSAEKGAVQALGIA
jgi:alpha-tubulin suppressor-like RCC1 family protein